ncbi:MAG: glycosyltransferase [Bacteriovorax sp.]|nr:glycosyltransferase [Bacteriovorax sp.]
MGKLDIEIKIMTTTEAQPLVSFVIPSYNSGKFLRQTLESCLNQTYPNIEILLINDGSTDNTDEILEEFKNVKNLHHIKNEKNEGIIYTLNRGMKLARGEFIARMDGDDICLPERVQEQVNFFNKHPEIDVLGTDIIIIDENNKKMGRPREVITSQAEVEWSMISSCPVFHPTVMLRKNLLDQEPFASSTYFGSDKIAEDLGLWGRVLLANKKIAVLNRPFLLYRKHSGSLTSGYASKQIDMAVSIVSKFAQSKWTIKMTDSFLLNIRKRDQFSDRAFFIEAKSIINQLKNQGQRELALAAQIDIQLMCLSYLHFYFKNQKKNKMQATINTLVFVFSLNHLNTLPAAFFKFYRGILRRIIK